MEEMGIARERWREEEEEAAPGMKAVKKALGIQYMLRPLSKLYP